MFSAPLHSSSPRSPSILELHRPSTLICCPNITCSTLGNNGNTTRLNFRSRNGLRLRLRHGSVLRFASSTDPPQGSNETKSTGSAQGPPFLTILAGFLVFSAVCWIIGSLVMWLIGLTIHPPPSK